MQFGHAIGPRSLKTHHRHKIALQLAAFETRQHFVLIIEYQRRRFHHAMRRIYRGYLDHRAAEVAAQHAQAAVGTKGRCRAAQDAIVAAYRRRRAPVDRTAIKLRLFRVASQGFTGDGEHIVVQQTGG